MDEGASEAIKGNTNILQTDDKISDLGIEGHDQTSEQQILYKGLAFRTLDEAYDYYVGYARSKGFGVTKSSTTLSRKVTKDLIAQIFTCDKAGRVSSSKTDCKANVRFSLDQDRGCWQLARFEDEHNHEMQTDLVGYFRVFNQFHNSPVAKNIMGFLKNAGLKTKDISKVINALQNDNEQRGIWQQKVTPQQCQDVIRGLEKRKTGTQCESVIRHFQEKMEADPLFYFRVKIHPETNTLCSVFWADGRSRASCAHYSDVITFDVTYRTNQFGLPFAPFTGVNNHRQSALFGCALMIDESKESFEWLFEEWKTCMGTAPKVIITDQCPSIGEALKKVFPQTIHSESIIEAEANYAILAEKHGDLTNDNWFIDNIYKIKEHWMQAYMNDVFTASMKSTQRSESINNFFRDYVNSTTPLDMFVIQYEKAVKSRREAEERQDFKTKNANMSNDRYRDIPFMQQAAKFYTSKVYKIFFKEFEACITLGHKIGGEMGDCVEYLVGILETNKAMWKKVKCYKEEERFTCSCSKFETQGILCRHILRIIHSNMSDKLIPKEYLLHRWSINARFQKMQTDTCIDDDPTSDRVSQQSLFSLKLKIDRAWNSAASSKSYCRKVTTALDNLEMEKEKEAKKSKIVDTVPCMDRESPISCPPTILTPPGNLPTHISVLDPTHPHITKGRPKKPLG